MKTLWFFIKLFIPYWKGMLLGLALTLITVLASIGLLSLSGWFISATAFAGLTTATALKFDFFLPAAGVRFFALLRIGGRYGERIINHDVTFKILSRLRLWLYQHLEPLAPAYLLKFRSADLLNRMVADVDAMDNLFLRVLVPTIVAILSIIILGVFIHIFSHPVATLIVVCLFFSILFLPLLGRVLARKTGKMIVEARVKLRIQAVDVVQGLPELLLADQAQQHIANIAAEDNRFILLQRKMACIQGFTGSLYILLLGLTLFFVAMATVHYSHHGAFSGAMIALIILGVMGAFEVIMPLPRAFQYLSETKAAGQRLIAVKDERPAVVFAKMSADHPKDASVLFKDVSFSYQKEGAELFQQLNLAIPHYQKLGVVGPTGSGKSSLLHLIARSFEVSTGTIELGGVNLQKLSEPDLRTQVTMITQRVHIFNGTLRENLLIAKPDASDETLLYALQQVQLSDYVAQLKSGLDTWMGEAGAKLSGGQARRVALARAILHDTSIWLLDEPTEGLDFETEEAILQVLKDLIQNKTVVMVSHREAPLQFMDRLIHMDEFV